MKWTEDGIARQISRVLLDRKYIVLCPNCNWTGHECDILAVTENFRIIDIEIKTSRQDFKNDRKKDKWFHAWDWKIDGPLSPENLNKRPRDWPQKVWKHLYCMPDEVWTDDLFEFMPEKSGLILLHNNRKSTQPDTPTIELKRAPKPYKDAEKLTHEQVLDIARLANIRMWDAKFVITHLKNDLENGNKEINALHSKINEIKKEKFDELKRMVSEFFRS